MNENITRCHQYLTSLYSDVAKNRAPVSAGHAIHQTQGEILFESVERLLIKMALTKNDVFVDLGSGVGEVVAQVFLRSVVKEARGIEIVPELHQIAVKIAEDIQKQWPGCFTDGRKLHYEHGNFLEASLDNASVIFVNGVCFGQSLLSPLGKIIDQATNITKVLTVRPIVNMERLRFREAFRIECSWDSALCYLYA